MKEITAEVRSLRHEVERATDVSSEVRALQHDVDEIASARRKTSG